MGQLQFGMYIAELDRPWTDTPFMFQGFHLRTDQQLETLKKFCKHVFVDVEKTEVEDRSRPRTALPSFKIRGNTAFPKRSMSKPRCSARPRSTRKPSPP